MTLQDEKDDRRVFRLRMPPDLKKWLAVSAAELDTSQHDLAIAILSHFAENPHGLEAFDMPRRSTRQK